MNPPFFLPVFYPPRLADRLAGGLGFGSDL